jgi:hypothetical protein
MSHDRSDDRSSARIAVGRFVLDIGDAGGAVVHEAPLHQRAPFRPRATPVLLLPRPIRGLVGRSAEIATAITAIDEGTPVEVSGGPGTGKTAILRHLAHHPRTSFADGTVFIQARHQSPLDLRQRLFDAFHESDTPCRPTDVEIRRSLKDTRALILLDEAGLTRHEVEQLFDAAPRCAFVVATRERCLWNEVRSVALRGLPVDDAIALLERDLERTLDAAERPAAADLCAAFEGQPRRIRHAAAIIRDRGIPLDRWRDHLTPHTLIAELLAGIDDRERRVLLALAALPAVSLDPLHVAGIAELTDVEAVMTALARRHLVASHESRYRVVDGIGDRLRQIGGLKPSINRSITYFTAWADRHRRNHEQLLEASDALMRVQEHAIDERRWGEVLRLGKQLERPLVAGGRWGAWEPVLERSLAAAKALGDRSVEAWALHQLGTRAVCLGDAGTARRLLGQAASLREELGETGAAAVSRTNLGCIVRTLPGDGQPDRSERPFDDIGDDDALPLHAGPGRASVRSGMSEIGALLIAVLLCAALAGFAYSIVTKNDPDQPLPPAAVATPAPQQTADDPPAPAPAAPAAPSAPQASILIFTARPGSIVTSRSTDLCYAVSGAVRTSIEPTVGNVESMEALTCRRVKPARTTTYELTAVGGDGIPVSRQVVIVVR